MTEVHPPPGCSAFIERLADYMKAHRYETVTIDASGGAAFYRAKPAPEIHLAPHAANENTWTCSRKKWDFVLCVQTAAIVHSFDDETGEGPFLATFAAAKALDVADECLQDICEQANEFAVVIFSQSRETLETRPTWPTWIKWKNRTEDYKDNV